MQFTLRSIKSAGNRNALCRMIVKHMIPLNSDGYDFIVKADNCQTWYVQLIRMAGITILRKGIGCVFRYFHS